MPEPLPIEFANTLHAVRGRVRDGLTTTAELADWLQRNGLPAEVTADDLIQARELRDAVRAIAHAVAHGRDPERVDITVVNTFARSTPRWRELHWSPQPHAVAHTTGTPLAAALSTVADATIALFTSTARDDLRACPGPGCVLHFVRDAPRREWCSPGCGNRARAARHYARSRDRTEP
ncbi:CGNR zinc finger domain-containing protein [Actinoplanes derwentensis]|uniref:Conserved protein containing a Zn-ribbon-like motif, possibly RNA-binding n=1 Tax=Actinoplanes derwentensis TaxID=113562 RepID=A0A1H1TDI3_9ACTN|nr:ABATE domain-containing protein [Actinoplanes derwentensis]GID89498.1 hypothetical protein Ade03nite_84220 [Actinoplanes derwentensis]SDS58375.1 Conserved protein containing a Zn-ribbon-like motif, possibly RNA-binding [Actinoplanes derwentensis]